MPRGQPFTALCQTTAKLARPVVADLHSHTTASDGDYTPSQLVAFARQARLVAIAVTDHDTIAGVAVATAAAQELGPTAPEVISGVELSAEFEGNEVHLLGLFVRTDDEEFNLELTAIQESRRQRFRAYMTAIADMGQPIDPGLIAATEARSVSLGRRHVAGLLVRTGIAHSWQDAWRRFMAPITPTVPRKRLVPMQSAVELIRGAGGIASLAHPPESFEVASFTRLADMGMQGMEVRFPAASVSRTLALIAIAKQLGLRITGGSDCHGGQDTNRSVGSRGVSEAELDCLREVYLSPGRTQVTAGSGGV